MMSMYGCDDMEQVTHVVPGCRRTRVGDTASAFMPTRQMPVMSIKFRCFLSLIRKLTDRLNIALFCLCRAFVVILAHNGNAWACFMNGAFMNMTTTFDQSWHQSMSQSRSAAHYIRPVCQCRCAPAMSVHLSGDGAVLTHTGIVGILRHSHSPTTW